MIEVSGVCCMLSSAQKIYCAFCKLERHIYVKKHANWTNVALSFFAATLLMMLVWREWDPRVVVFSVVFIAIAEVFVRVRWRMGLPCPHCDFDPLLYKTNREAAVQRVKAKLAHLKQSGQYLLKKNNPFQNIATIKMKSDDLNKKRPTPRYLSREI